MQKFLLELQEKQIKNLQMTNEFMQKIDNVDGDQLRKLYNANATVCQAIEKFVKGEDYGLKRQRVGRGTADFHKKVFDTYNAQKIQKHKTLTPKMKEVIDVALGKYKQDEIIQAIERYGKMYHDNVNEYASKYITYKWTLADFISRGNAMPDFMDEGSKWKNYMKGKKEVVEKKFKFDV